MQTIQPAYSSAFDDQIWQQYDSKRLQRLRQQRQRMENMKDVVGQYSAIIGELEHKNWELIIENQQLKLGGRVEFEQYSQLRKGQYQIQLISLQRAYDEVCKELDRERNARENCEVVIDNLREQLRNACQMTRNISSTPVNNYPLYSGQSTEIQANYHALIGLYQQLKKQVYVLNKENISLKEVIRDQSRVCYQKDQFWKQNKRELPQIDQNTASSNKQNKPGVIRISSKTTIKTQPQQQSQSQSQQLNSTSNPSSTLNSTHGPSKRDYQLEIKKQGQLIQKFKRTQKKQSQLIQILKNQKSRICSHHALMMTSKKLLLAKGQDGIVSFKNQVKQGSH